MAGRHSREVVVVTDGWPVLDCTDLSPRELRARVADLRYGHEARVEQARDELSASLDRLVEGVRVLRARVTSRTRAAIPVLAGVAVVGVTTVLAVRITSGRRA